jgi:hypothetical protein
MKIGVYAKAKRSQGAHPWGPKGKKREPRRIYIYSWDWGLN